MKILVLHFKNNKFILNFIIILKKILKKNDEQAYSSFFKLTTSLLKANLEIVVFYPVKQTGLPKVVPSCINLFLACSRKNDSNCVIY